MHCYVTVENTGELKSFKKISKFEAGSKKSWDLHLLNL